MKGTLSPILSHIVQSTFSTAGEKDKLDRLINKYRRMLKLVTGGYNTSEIRFGLADLLITRDDPSDWGEAKTHYEFVIQNAPYGYIRSASMVGLAELAMKSTDKKRLNEAVEYTQRAHKGLVALVGQNDFYTIKCMVVEAELRLKRGDKGDERAALSLFEKVFENDVADPYFRARAIVNHSEMLLYKKGTDFNRQIQLCHKAIDLLKERPNDYFAIKARLLQGEFISRRLANYDKSRSTGIFMGIIGNKNADPDLATRAKLDLAEISDKPKALKLIKEVKKLKIIDPYLLEKAKIVEQFIKAKK